jgi:magnesium chelatase family protein
MVGPPGSGKSMLAQRFAALLPALDPERALESAAVLSLVGRFEPAQWGRRVTRSPHHTASAVALVGGGGGGGGLRPGEISLAHHGVLFLDELPEFDRSVLESLREPLETGHIHISRAARQAEFPAQFQLIAAMNPCPCGYLGHPTRACRCTPDQVARYQGRISGPLLDRIDIQIEVGAIAPDALLQLPQGESSAIIAARVAAAAAVQLARQGSLNARLRGAALDTHCALDAASSAFFAQALQRLGWSARAAHRVLRLARTIADLAGSAQIASPHLAEAMQLRRALAQQ